RVPHHRGHARGRSRVGQAVGAGVAVPAGRGCLRGALRDGPDSGRRARPPDPGPAARQPGHRRVRTRRGPAAGAGAGLDTRAGRPRSRLAHDCRREATGRGRARSRGRVKSTRFPPQVEVDDDVVRQLREVCSKVEVDERVRIEAGTDWWPLTMVWARNDEIPAMPAVVARPSSAAEIAAVLAVCSGNGVPVTPFAGRSGVCGASLPVFGGVSLDVGGLAGIVDVDDESLLVDVLPGTYGHHFEDALRSDHDLTMGHWPQSIE